VARALGNRSRFLVAYLALGATVGAALGAFIVLARRPGPAPSPPWSTWRPGANSLSAQMLEIADHVGRSYHLSSGDQLTAVKVGSPAGGRALRAIGVPTTSQPQSLDDFDLYRQNESVIYVLCGDGNNCNITEGKPSGARGAVLRREALELALYTLKYAQPIDNVLVFFPPAPGKKKLTRTLFFHRGNLESPLKHPLRRTLPQARPPLPGRINPSEERAVDDLTGETRYEYVGIFNAPDFGRMLVVTPPG
jgi:hypothetical protein